MRELVMTPWMKTRIGARILLLQARWDPARMQGPGFAFALDPWLVECWAKEPKELLAARRRHFEYFNTHPIAAWFVAGIVCRQEAAAAVLSGTSREEMIAKISSLKENLGASLAGLYDSFFWGALRPASALAGLLSMPAAYRLGAPYPLAWGPAAALAAYNIPAMAARILGLLHGAAEGELAVAKLTRIPVQSWITGMRRATFAAALLMFAAAAAQVVGGERLVASLLFVSGLILTWRGVSPLVQLGFVGFGGMAASASGLWP